MTLQLFILSLQLSACIVIAKLTTEDFARAADHSLTFLGAQRSGVLPRGGAPTWRYHSGQQYSSVRAAWYNETTASVIQILDLSGGFYSGGEVGPVKPNHYILFGLVCARVSRVLGSRP